MGNLSKKLLNLGLRKKRIRSKIIGTTERPRLSVSVSNKHVSAQLIDDIKQCTIISSTTVGTNQTGTITDKAIYVGSDIAKKAKKVKITKIVFDRNGRLFARRLNALADTIRKEGLEF
ncbi:MAG TPA: 50S ribosomal protein L18 [Candidatus Saccharibacteria bacterium]|nr:50S ribosomal protein L18 [Candidatus Saccharibacteria bacterium]